MGRHAWRWLAIASVATGPLVAASCEGSARTYNATRSIQCLEARPEYSKNGSIPANGRPFLFSVVRYPGRVQRGPTNVRSLAGLEVIFVIASNAETAPNRVPILYSVNVLFFPGAEETLRYYRYGYAVATKVRIANRAVRDPIGNVAIHGDVPLISAPLEPERHLDAKPYWQLIADCLRT